MTTKPLKLGFALEGNSDYNIVPILTRRYIAQTYPTLNLAPTEPLRPKERGNGFIKSLPTFAKLLAQNGASVLIAVLDTDDAAVGERRKSIQAAIQKCKDNRISICISYGLAVKSLEAWLLSDMSALSHVFASEKTLDEQKNPETNKDPKATLNRAVQQITEGIVRTYANRANDLAEHIELNKISARCSRFRDFLKEIDTCLKPFLRNEPISTN